MKEEYQEVTDGRHEDASVQSFPGSVFISVTIWHERLISVELKLWDSVVLCSLLVHSRFPFLKEWSYYRVSGTKRRIRDGFLVNAFRDCLSWNNSKVTKG